MVSLARPLPVSLANSKQIQSTSLHVRLPLPLQLHFWPFIALYVGWAAAWLYLTWLNPGILQRLLASDTSHLKYPFLSFGFWIKYEEFMLIPLFLLLVAHFLTIMSCYWSVAAKAFLTCRVVATVPEAELVLVKPIEHRGKPELCPVKRSDKDELFFEYQQRRFYWDKDRKLFAKPSYPDRLSMGEYQKARGLSGPEVAHLKERFGRNAFDLPIPTFMSLFKEHAIAPFFVFQIFCVALWCLDEYWYYSLFTLFLLVVFESIVVAQRLRTMEEFRGMSVAPIDVWVRRMEEWTMTKSDQLFPSDLCALPWPLNTGSDGLTVPCDIVLLSGSCIANEAMISGESTPLLKESVVDADPEGVLDIAEADHQHVLFGGTKILQIHAAAMGTNAIPGPPLSSPVVFGFVARTGFGTLQGRLVRTMMYSSEQVTANNMEAFFFIGFLLIFALAAAGYVLVKGVEEEGRSRYKLLLECVLIITAVVPPELPMQLSLAVNSSLQDLAKFAIFCMEPFRIPLAGKLDICCFDKTGTITAENLIVDGLAGIADDSDGTGNLVQRDLKVFLTAGALRERTLNAVKVMAACHSLFLVQDSVIAGDPMERATLDFINWELLPSDTVKARGSGPSVSYRIVHRFPFSSALKRMSCLARSTPNGELFAAVKGAPEVLMGKFRNLPSWYERTFLRLAQSGARVLALGYRSMASTPLSSAAAFKHLQRSDVECELEFCGFLVFRCPLKPDSKEALQLLKRSCHQVVMITGDNALTAIHTAKEVEMIGKTRRVLLVDAVSEGRASVTLTDAATMQPFKCDWDLNESDPRKILDAMVRDEISLCFTGNGYDAMAADYPRLLNVLLPHVAIHARASPTQKESILARLKSPPLSYHTLMCGDGTNDVGALKQAHIGIALLDGRPEDLPRILKEMREAQLRKHRQAAEESRRKWEERARGAAPGRSDGSSERLLQKLMEANAEGNADGGDGPLVKLGDASVAAPFTSKISTIHSVCNLVRQGRCTLVTTIQMYKILALNSLITAYSLSVLHLSGIRYGDFQMTITGMLLSACFMFLTRGRPIREMSASRPQSNIFNAYLLTSVLGQFALHVGALVYVTQAAGRFIIPWRTSEKLKFAPGLMNTAVYLLGLLMQVSTFVVNYQGRPHRESLLENKPLRNSLLAVAGVGMLASLELMPEFNEWLELVPMPPVFRRQLVTAIIIDFGGCFVIEWLASRLFSSNRPRFAPILE